MANIAISFPDANNGIITCIPSPLDGVRIKVELSSDASPGSNVKADWQGYNDASGADPIPETATSLSHKLTQPDIDNGFILVVTDYFKHIRPIKRGSAQVTITIDGNDSTSAHIRFRIANLNGLTCEELPPNEAV